MTTKYQSPIGHGWALGTAFSGALLYTYQAGTTTDKATYKDNAGAASHTNPIVLDGNGAVPGGALWLDSDTAYKFTLKNSTAATTYWTIDNIDPVVNPDTTTVSEWISGPTPTYINATSFSVAGDYTGTLQVGRRLRLTDASTLYATVTAASYAATITTVTVAVDGGSSLTSSLASFAYGILASTSRSIPRGPMQSAALADAAASLEVWREYTITPTTTRVLTLPTTQVQAGDRIRVMNLATDGSATTVNASGGSAKVSFTDGVVELYALQAAPTTPAHWGIANTAFDTSGGEGKTKYHSAAGGADEDVYVGGVLYWGQTTTGNVGAGEDTLDTYTLPAGLLSQDGNGFKVTVHGAGNGSDNVTIKFYVGATALTIHTGVAITGRWGMTFYVWRTGATTFELRAEGFNLSTTAYVRNAQAATWANANVVKITGENTTDTSDSAVTTDMMLIEMLNAS